MGYGINTGSVVAGYMGSRRTHSYTVIGDCVNVAARLCGKASPGQILVGDPIVERLEEKLSYETLERVELKGKTNKVQVYSVTDLQSDD